MKCKRLGGIFHRAVYVWYLVGFVPVGDVPVVVFEADALGDVLVAEPVRDRVLVGGPVDDRDHDDVLDDDVVELDQQLERRFEIGGDLQVLENRVVVGVDPALAVDALPVATNLAVSNSSKPSSGCSCR